jgi:plastocyanin
MLPNGPGDADQRAVNPCFISTGSLPADAKTACPTVAQPAFDGTQKYYSSGFISKGSDFKMTLASTIKPGTYHYYCNLHGPDMSGTITVAPSGSSIPSQSDVDSAGQTQLNDLVSKITPAIQSAASGHPQVPPGIKVAPNLAGFASQDVSTVTIDQFFPATIHTTVGKTVSWTIVGAHTISFGEPSNPPYALKEAPDGTWHADEQAGSPVPPPPGPPPSGNSNAPITVDGGSYNGSGIASSGVQASFPPALVTYNLKFTKAGTYNYVCLIHPGMVGQVVVS